MNQLPMMNCKECGKPRPAAEVMTRFYRYNSPALQIRFHKCLACRAEAKHKNKHRRVYDRQLK